MIGRKKVRQKTLYKSSKVMEKCSTNCQSERRKEGQLREDKIQLRSLQIANRAEMQKLTELLEQHLRNEQLTGDHFSSCLTILFSFV